MKGKAHKLSILSASLFAVLALSLFALPSGRESFPPLPSAEQRSAQNPQERNAGVVILSQSLHISGFARIGAFRTKGSITQEIRSRYIVLDSKGARAVSRHIFLGGTGSTIKEVTGRTVTPDGKIYTLDPKRDVKNLDIRTAGGKTSRAMRAAFFPHVVTGSILDLSYTVVDRTLPNFEIVPLQGTFPIRHLKVYVKGQILKKAAWVPFFLGPAPPGARASLDNHFNLTLDLDDVPPTRDEPLAPPAIRAGYRLGLMPMRVTSFRHPFGDGDTVKYARLFGRPPRVLQLALLGSSRSKGLAGAIKPSAGTAVLDDLGLQVPPEWIAGQDAKPVMAWWNDVLGGIDKQLEEFFRHTATAGDADDLSSVAPTSLPLEERVTRLYRYARKRVHPDPGADDQRSLNALMASGHGDERDVDLYLVYLLRTAGIPARVVLAFNRYSPVYQPALESFRPFSTSYFVKASPPGSPPIYLMPGDPFATVNTFPQAYLGALAFVQPDDPRKPWSISRITPDLQQKGLTKVSFVAALAGNDKRRRLRMNTALTDDAAYVFRWELGWDRPKTLAIKEKGHVRTIRQGEKSISDRWKKVYDAWMESWANIKPQGDLPKVNARLNVDKPLIFAMQGDWNPEIRRIGNRLLVPAFPRADIFVNPFQSDRRYDPIWWRNPGDYEITMTWYLPPGSSLEELPPPARAQGPGGLSFAATFSPKPLDGKGTQAEVLCTMRIHFPAMLPASAYPQVKSFCESLQHLSDTHFLVDLANTGAQE